MSSLSPSTLLQNPVFRKEMRARTRGRRATRGTHIGAWVVIGGAVAAVYWLVLRAIFGPNGGASAAHDIFAILTIGVQTTLLLFLAPSVASGSITLEREQQTWNALLLSRLSAREIVGGKYAAALVLPLAMLALFAPLDLIAAVRGGEPPAVVLVSGAMLLSGALFYTALGLFCSWAQRRTHTATAAAFGGVAALAVGTGLLFILWAIAVSGSGGNRGDPRAFPPMWLNPYLPMALVVSPEDERQYGPAAANITFCLVATFVLLAAVTRRLNRGPGELEQ
jgi:ABC-type transport system involved in multi-copper enzyme maturation permease subunit